LSSRNVILFPPIGWDIKPERPSGLLLPNAFLIVAVLHAASPLQMAFVGEVPLTDTTPPTTMIDMANGNDPRVNATLVDEPKVAHDSRPPLAPARANASMRRVNFIRIAKAAGVRRQYFALHHSDSRMRWDDGTAKPAPAILNSVP
jgi:hypothetical protein